MKLRGQRNQCQGCKEYFNSNYAFDKHRTGKHGVNRRCRSPEEMLELGMLKNQAGFWVSSAGIYRGEDDASDETEESAEGGETQSAAARPHV
jgi:hypothetical protein